MSPTRPPQVTVVTPVYNVASFVAEAVDSVLRQTYDNFEYLVVDDGSSDDSVDIVLARAGRDPRFRLVQGEHRGLSAARNTGIRESKAEYVAYLDGDDRWRPRFLERQIALIESLPPKVGAVFCRSRVMLENGTLAFLQWQPAGSYDFDDLLAAGNPSRNGSSLLIRRSCFDDVGGFDEDLRYVEDAEMWLRIAWGSKTPLFWGSRHYLLDWRLRPGSVTRDLDANATALSALLAEQTPRMRRLPAGLAYVRPAASLLKYGGSHSLAQEWEARARSVGVGRLLRTMAGMRLLFWSLTPERGRRLVRSLQRATREAVKTANLRIRPVPGQAGRLPHRERDL